MRFAVCLVLLEVFAVAGDAQSVPPQPAPVTNDRSLGIFPGFRVADANKPFVPISNRRKMYIAFRDSTDLPVFLTTGALAGIYQWQDTNPSFGQGAAGYARRYGTSYGDLAIGNMLTVGVFPSAFGEDPRYFRRGEAGGSKKRRFLYAASRIFVTRTDRGNNRFNFSEVVGTAATAGIGNAYYPDNRDVGANFRRFGIALGIDSLGFVLKEFSPDITHFFSKITH
jgi:hypothetical protein